MSISKRELRSNITYKTVKVIRCLALFVSLRYLKLMDLNISKAKIYYDGLCILCSKEIEIYRKNPESYVFEFIDITLPSFNAEKEGLDPFKIHKVMHVRTRDGAILTAVDAFIYIWSLMPSYSWMARLAQISFIKWFMNIGYVCFATIRPLLPKKKRLCEDSPYCEKP